MKKQFALLSAISLFAIGVVTFSSCKKTSSAFAGNYAGQLADTLTSVNDTVAVTISGSNVTIKDNNTGATFTGTLGNTTSAGGNSVAEITTLSGSVKLGTVTATYSGSAGLGSFTTISGTTTVSFDLSDSYGSIFTFGGNKY